MILQGTRARTDANAGRKQTAEGSGPLADAKRGLRSSQSNGFLASCQALVTTARIRYPTLITTIAVAAVLYPLRTARQTATHWSINVGSSARGIMLGPSLIAIEGFG